MDRQAIDLVKSQHDLRFVLPKVDRKSYGDIAFDVCPFHADSHPSLMITPTYYKCLACGKNGDLFTWMEHNKNWNFSFTLQNHTQIIEAPVPLETEKKEVIQKVFPNIMALSYHFGLTDTAMQFYVAKGFWPSTILRFKLGFGAPPSDTEARFTIPLFEEGKLYGIKFRRNDCCPNCGNNSTIMTKEKFDEQTLEFGFCPKCDTDWEADGAKFTSLYKQRIFLWGLKDIPDDYTGTVYICEGEWDRITLWQHGYYAVTSTGGCNSFNKRFATSLSKFRRKVIMFDQDGPGREAAENIQSKLIPDAKIFPEWSEGKDITDVASKVENFQDWMKHLDKKCG